MGEISKDYWNLFSGHYGLEIFFCFTWFSFEYLAHEFPPIRSANPLMLPDNGGFAEFLVGNNELLKKFHRNRIEMFVVPKQSFDYPPRWLPTIAARTLAKIRYFIKILWSIEFFPKRSKLPKTLWAPLSSILSLKHGGDSGHFWLVFIIFICRIICSVWFA